MNEESNSFLVEGSIWTYLGNGQFRMSLVEPALSPHYQDNMLEVPGKQGGKDDPKSHGGYEEYKKNPVYKRLESAMEILAIGDIHGRDFLSSIEPDNNDKIIFLGDYCDSHCHGQISDFAILENLRQIIEFRKACPHKVVLLLGNHDVHYMYHKEVDECSGFRNSMLDDLQSPGLQQAALPLQTLADSVADTASADPLLAALGEDPVTLDALLARTGESVATLSARLLELELAGQVARLPGGLYQRRHSG